MEASLLPALAPFADNDGSQVDVFDGATKAWTSLLALWDAVPVLLRFGLSVISAAVILYLVFRPRMKLGKRVIVDRPDGHFRYRGVYRKAGFRKAFNVTVKAHIRVWNGESYSRVDVPVDEPEVGIIDTRRPQNPVLCLQKVRVEDWSKFPHPPADTDGSIDLAAVLGANDASLRLIVEARTRLGIIDSKWREYKQANVIANADRR